MGQQGHIVDTFGNVIGPNLGDGKGPRGIPREPQHVELAIAEDARVLGNGHGDIVPVKLAIFYNKKKLDIIFDKIFVIYVEKVSCVNWVNVR